MTTEETMTYVITEEMKVEIGIGIGIGIEIENRVAEHKTRVEEDRKEQGLDKENRGNTITKRSTFFDDKIKDRIL